ncbi:membrane protein [soil metagenome]|nr:hypothetical protein [Gemmatimonadota bacterium]
MLGLLLFGLAISLMVRSELGLGPWDAFHVGLHQLTGISIGGASIAVGLVIVLGTYFIGVRPGPGTVANMVLIGIFTDLLLPLVPQSTHWAWSGAYYITAIGMLGIATGMYIAAGLGKGPRDGMMIALSQRSGWPVRRMRTLIEVSALTMGWLMGGKIGVGTVLFTLMIGPTTQWGLQLFGLTATGASRVLPIPMADTEVPGTRGRAA